MKKLQGVWDLLIKTQDVDQFAHELIQFQIWVEGSLSSSSLDEVVKMFIRLSFQCPSTHVVLYPKQPRIQMSGFSRWLQSLLLEMVCVWNAIENLRPTSRALDCMPIPTDDSPDHSAGAVCVATCTRRQCVPIMVTTHDTLLRSWFCAQSLARLHQTPALLV